MVKEKTITNSILKLLNSQSDCWAVKIHGGPYQRAGLPDIIGHICGRFVGIEVKVPGKSPTPIQNVIIKEITSTGAVATWVTNIDDVEKLVAEIRSGY